MIDPDERLKRIWESTCEKMDHHSVRKEEAENVLQNESMVLKDSDRHMINYFYHDGYLDAISYIRYLFRMWEGTKEKWFEMSKPYEGDE